MKLNLRALILTGGILWGGAFLLTVVANAVWPTYGVAFIALMASVYPGYHGLASFGDIVVGTLYAIVDGAVFALALGVLYNYFVGKSSS